MSTKKLVNNYCLVIDKSTSMRGREADVIRVFDGQIAWLAQRSRELGQDAYVSVYTFNDQVQRVIDRVNVQTLPSLRGLYGTYGNTALRDAVIQSQRDLAKTPVGYDDHAFLTFVITDGQENASRESAGTLKDLLAQQPDNWTVAALVPNLRGKLDCEAVGFPKGNIEVWDINSSTGLEEAGVTIRGATETILLSRSTGGPSGSKTLFAGSAQQVNAATVAAAGLKPLDPDRFFLFPAVATGNMATHIPKRSVTRANPNGIKHVEIKEMVESTGRTYMLGNGYYELTKSEKVSGNKGIAVVERATSKVYLGKEARQLIGLDDSDRRVRPMPLDSSGHAPFKIFIQSQSTNRLLPVGSQVLYLK